MKPLRFTPILVGLALVLTSAHGQITVDDTVTFTTSPGNQIQRTSPYAFEVDGVFDPNFTGKTIPGALADFDPTGSDKIIVAFASENAKSVVSITYGGEPMNPVVVANNSDVQLTGIYYLDLPTGPGDLVFTFSGSYSNGVGGSLMAVSGTLLGEASVTADSPGQSATITTTEAKSLIVASQANNGGGATAQSPFTALFDAPVGSGGGGTGYLNLAAINTYTPELTGSTSRPVTAAAAFAPTLPRNPNPNGGIIAGGDVPLTWTNLDPTTGTDVWVDVWFGTDPDNLTQVVSADPDGLNLTSFIAVDTFAGTYYWRVDSYLDGTPTGTPLTGSLFTFTIIDSDSDGLPDDWEELYFGGPTAANPGDDPDADGLTNLGEFELGTDPTMADTDGDGLDDNIETNTGIWVSASDTGTDPLAADTDGDGLLDGVETNTGTWVSVADTGTDPLAADTDGDGLSDGVETNTGTFVSSSDTGSDPHAADTDGDGSGDWYEVAAAFTDPNDANDTPSIPYPLPDPVASDLGDASKPVKVYIMSGQSNMVGFGTVNGTADHTLETMTIGQNKFPNLIDGSNNWTVRQDVRYRGVISDIANTQLSPGNLGTGFGPELGFGYIMGWYHDEPVLLIKSCTGNRGLGWDILPPGSPSYEYDGQIYAGYGEGPSKRPIGDPPATDPGWWAGREYDRFFMDESEWVRPQGEVENVVDVLDNFATEYPEWADQGFEIAGFVWWQGDKDRYDMGYATKYEENLVNLIDSLRNYYSNRYPGQVVANAPFVLATLGQTPLTGGSNAAEQEILDAQLAVDGDAGNYPQYAGNVKTVYAHPLSQGGASNSHYNGHAATYMLVGDALGNTMVELLETETTPAPFSTWADTYPDLSDTTPGLDFDDGGLATALEWVFGGDPTNSGDDTGLVPTFDATSDPDGKLLFIFRRDAEAAADPDTTIIVEYGSDLTGWTAATHQGTGPGDITISEVPDGFGAGVDQVTVALPPSVTAEEKLFVRLSAGVSTP